jgi:hypothetical protein
MTKPKDTRFSDLGEDEVVTREIIHNIAREVASLLWSLSNRIDEEACCEIAVQLSDHIIELSLQ